MICQGKTGFGDTKQPRPESTFADHNSARQSAFRETLGLYNNDDMFLDEIRPFLKHYGPSQITEDQITKCIEGMINAPEAVVERTPDDYLGFIGLNNGFPPSADPLTENKLFKHFGKIVDQIIQHNPVHPLAALHVRLCPAHWVTSNVDKGMYKIDACFTVIPQQNEIANHHIMLPMVLAQERTDKSRIEVHQHILGACHHILNEDLRRMWIFSITVEDSFISLWYFSRSHLVKSYAADWVKDPRLLVQIILAVANADYCSLGIDPTVHIGPTSHDEKTLSYVYEVPSEVAGGSPTFYKTGQIRSPAPPLNIVGRGTNVWEVTQVTSASGEMEVNPGKRVILKDVWLDEDQPTEGKTIERIFEAVDSFVSIGLEAQIRKLVRKNPGVKHDVIMSNPRTTKKLMEKFISKDKRFKAFEASAKGRLVENLINQNYRSLFLSKVCEWKGQLSLKVRGEAKRYKNLFSRNPNLVNSTTEASTTTGRRPVTTNRRVQKSFLAMSVLQKERQSTLKQTEDSARQFVQKQQVRIIYNEVCHSLYELPTLGNVFDILCEAIDACHILFCAGWVHRDISAANILALQTGPNQSWKVKLADLEFARPMIEDKRIIRSDPRTGTAFFMPTEIFDRRYLFAGYYDPAAVGRQNMDTVFEDEEINPSPDSGTLFKDNTDDSQDYNDSGSSSNDDSGDDDSKEILPPSVATQFGLKPKDAAYCHLKDYLPVPFIFTPTKIPRNVSIGTIEPHKHLVNHNYQHDLESIWWIAVWYITCNVQCKASSDWASDIFRYDVDDSKTRTSQFAAPVFDMALHLRPELQADFPIPINFLRRVMNREYILREFFGHLELPESYSKIHNSFANAFRGISSKGGSWRDLTIDMEHDPKEVQVSLLHPVATGMKRGRGESDGENEESKQTQSTYKKLKGNNK